ncbi:unnamed protein product [Ixodes pacificus]
MLQESLPTFQQTRWRSSPDKSRQWSDAQSTKQLAYPPAALDISRPLSPRRKTTAKRVGSSVRLFQCRGLANVTTIRLIKRWKWINACARGANVTAQTTWRRPPVVVVCKNSLSSASTERRPVRAGCSSSFSFSLSLQLFDFTFPRSLSSIATQV